MDITAIICEYNPFHKGHKYQIDKIKESYPDTVIISIMSPNFVQRGRPAIFDKFARGECAVRCGVDLAVSMPQVFSVQSAEGFAEGGVRLAKLLGANSLSFGVENDDIETLKTVASVLTSNDFESELQKELVASPALSYPFVRQQVLRKFIGDNACIIDTPNNILAVEYIKASLRYAPDMQFRAIKREGNAYHDQAIQGEYVSASAIRSVISQRNTWEAFVPKDVYDVLNSNLILDNSRYDDFLFSVLSVAKYDDLLDTFINKELTDIVFSSIKKYGDYASFRSNVLRKKFTETKIDRALLSFLLGLKTDEFLHAVPEYVTFLSSNTNGRAILNNVDLKIISKFKNTKQIYGKQIEYELLADRIWARCTEAPVGEEYFINKKPFISEESK